MNPLKSSTIFPAAIGLIALFSLTQCVVPYESARMLPKGTTEVKAAFTHASQRYRGDGEGLNNGLGFGVGYGFSRKFNFKVRYDRIFINDADGEGLNFIGFGPKIALKQDVFALAVPFGAYFADGDDTWGMFPALLATIPGKNNHVETTFGLRSDIFFEEDADVLFGLNVGLGLSKNLDVWAIRADFGLVFNPGEDGVLLTFGLGASYNIASGK